MITFYPISYCIKVPSHPTSEKSLVSGDQACGVENFRCGGSNNLWSPSIWQIQQVLKSASTAVFFVPLRALFPILTVTDIWSVICHRHLAPAAVRPVRAVRRGVQGVLRTDAISADYRLPRRSSLNRSRSARAIMTCHSGCIHGFVGSSRESSEVHGVDFVISSAASSHLRIIMRLYFSLSACVTTSFEVRCLRRAIVFSSHLLDFNKLVAGKSLHDFPRPFRINGGGIGAAVKTDAAKRKRWFGWWCGHSKTEQPFINEGNHLTAHATTPSMTMAAINTNIAPPIIAIPVAHLPHRRHD